MSNLLGMKPLSDDDADLVSLCRKGDIRAFESLVNKHQKRVLNLAYRMIGDYEEACEVVQDAFLSAYRSLGKFRGESKFLTWLCAITLNLARNRSKQMKGRSRHLGLPPENSGDGSTGFPDPPDQGPSALEAMERKELQMKVAEAMGHLEQEFREVIILRDVQGFSYEEIRDILKIPEGTVKSRLYRARDVLKDHLKKSLGDF